MRIDTPPTIIDRVDERLSELESHVAQLEILQQLMLRLLSIMHPLSNVLAQYGANATQEQDLLQYLDQLAERVHSLERTRQPTLRVERVAYRGLHDYMHAQGWPARLAPRT